MQYNLKKLVGVLAGWIVSAVLAGWIVLYHCNHCIAVSTDIAVSMDIAGTGTGSYRLDSIG